MDWNLTIQGAQAVGQIAAACVAFYALHLVHRYTTKKDRADFLRNVWQSQQMTNLATLDSAELLQSHERIVYGDDYQPDDAEVRKWFQLFLTINKAQDYYVGWKNGLIDRAEFESLSKRTLRLIKRQEQLVSYLLAERGYDDDFRAEMLSLLAQVKPVNPRDAN